MLHENVEKVFRQVEEMREEIIKFTQDLIRIPTENPPGRNYPEFAELVGKKLEEFDYEVEYVEVPEELLGKLAPEGEGLPRINVIGRLKGVSDKPVIHFNGHYDVVPAGTGWSVDPYGAVIRDGRIYGRGSSDQKSGIAAQIFAIEAIRRSGFKLKGTVEQSATVDEETGGFAGVGYLVSEGYLTSGKVDYCIITECLNVDRICIGHRGAMWFEVKTYGKKAHGCMPKLGVNAIDRMVMLLNKVNQQLRPKIEKRKTKLPVVPPEAQTSSLTPTIIQAGVKVNVVPDECVVKFDRRLIPEENVEDAWMEILNTFSELKKEDPQFRYEIRKITEVKPTLVPTDTEIVKVFSNAIKDVLGEEPKFVLSPGFDDQRFVVHDGGIKQCIVYGPGILTQAHVTDEYVLIDDLINSVKIMALATMKLLGTS